MKRLKLTTLPSSWLILAAAGLLAPACTPEVPYTAPPGSVVSVVFDPTTSRIPLPNDLVLSQDPATLAVPPAQQEFLRAFITQGGFPNDQEVALTIDFERTVIDAATGGLTHTAPKLNLASFTSSTCFVYGWTDGRQGPIPLDPISDKDYVDHGTFGTLTLHHQGRQPWAPGQYAFLVRGGPDGVSTDGNEPIWSSQVFHLLEQGQDLTKEQNIGLLRAQLGTAAAAVSAAKQLTAIGLSYKDTVFLLADQRFPHEELAVAGTFKIAAKVTQVELDPGRGLVPLPIDLLREQKAGGTLTPLAACTLAAGKLDDKGACSSAAAAGFATLDGFSTTGMILASMSELISASTLTSTSVRLYDLSNAASPTLVSPSSYVTEPCEVTQSGLSPVIALQPAGATACDNSALFRTKPLKDNTDYAVVITTGVRDKAGNAIGPGTVGKILMFENPLVSHGRSNLQGIDDATAESLEIMRLQLKPVIEASGLQKSEVAMAYTFHTQTILKTAVQLAALPYTKGASTAVPGTVTGTSASGAFRKYGLDPRVVPSSHIAEVIETTITTFNLLDPLSGAFSKNAPVPETINVLIAVPQAADAPACSGTLAPFGAAGLHCAPMAIFRHGINGGRADMLSVADGLAAKGLVTVAIDAAKHGDRAFCKANSECAAGTCVPDPMMVHQGDAPGATPGHCMMDATTAAPFKYRTTDCPAGACPNPNSSGITLASGNYVISANFFRARDTFRQDIIDQSQLVRAIAFVPTGAPPTGHGVFDHMAGVDHLIINPAEIYYVGQSLGSLQGAMNVAANPRISKAVMNVGGGTMVDLFLNSPSYTSLIGQLLGSLGITKGANSQYIQFLVVAKTILDPADPINFVGHLKQHNLPNLLPPLGGNIDGSVPQMPKKVLAQMAYCDQTVPNPFGYIYASNAGTGPLPPEPGFGTGSGDFQVYVAAQTDFRDCPYFGGAPLPPAATAHGFLTDWTVPNPMNPASLAKYGLTYAGQRRAAEFLMSDTLPPSVQIPMAPQ